MTPTHDGSISRRGLSAEFKQAEKDASRFILEANALKSAGQRLQAAQKFAQAATLELSYGDELLDSGLFDLYYIHRFSAASCLAQAGNLYQAMQICQDLLGRFELPNLLRKRITDYLNILETRMEQWMTSYAPDVVSAAD